MKKSISLALAASMLLSMCVACSSSSTTSTTTEAATTTTTTTTSTTATEVPSVPESTGEKLSADANPLVTDTDTVYISLASDLESMDPIIISTINTNEVMSSAYESLVNYDLQGNVTPGIASDWTYDEDTLTYTINLRDDVYFHDGSLLTSEDVAYSLEVGKATGRFSLSCNYIDTVTIIDDFTVEVSLTTNYGPFLYFLGINLDMICKATNESTGLAEVENGTGPYKMVSYTPGVEVVFEAFEDYYGEQPAIKNLVFKIIPDGNTQFIALETGELNLSRDFPMTNIDSILENEELNIYQGESGNVYYMGINQAHEAMANVLVRQAINYAIDRDFIIEACEEGYAVQANSIANKGMFGYTEDAKYYEYDPEKAKELLAEAGYPDGLVIDQPILTKTGKYQTAAEIIQEDLKNIGIEIAIDVKDSTGFSDDFKKGNFALTVTSINLSQDAHHAAMSFGSTGYLNYFNINDPELDAMVEAGAQEADSEVRAEIYHDMLCKVADDALYAPLYYPAKVWAVTSGLDNTTYDRYVGVLAKYMEWN